MATNIDELLSGLGEVADEPIGEQNMDEAKAAAAKLEEILARLKAGINAVIAKEKATMDEAREIMGREFLGSEAAEKTWGREFKEGEIPQIPFSKEDLERAKKLGQFLELRVDKDGKDKGLSMRHQNDLLKERFEKEGKGKVLREEKGWKQDEEFFTEDTPRLRWVLVTKDVIPGSTGKNAVARTRVLADYVKNVIFKGHEIPEEYTEALKEFDEQEAEITALMDTDWQECNRRLAALKLNQMCRRTPSEAMFDTENHLDNTGERLLPNMYDQTTRLSSDGDLVPVGDADSAGACVARWRPSHASPIVGVVLSRSR